MNYAVLRKDEIFLLGNLLAKGRFPPLPTTDCDFTPSISWKGNTEDTERPAWECTEKENDHLPALLLPFLSCNPTLPSLWHLLV